MTDGQRTLKIGLLPGMIELYERLAPGLREKLGEVTVQAKAVLEAEGMAVAAGEVAATREQVRRECQRLGEAGVDLLVVAHVTYCPSGVLVDAIVEAGVPTVLWPAQPMFELRGETYDFDTVLLNHGVHGTQDLANVLRRRGVAFGVVHGHWKQKDTLAQLREFAAAGRALRAMRDSQPVQIGGHFEDMLDLPLTDQLFLERMGLRPTAVDVDEFAARIEGVDRSAVREMIEAYRREFRIDTAVDRDLLKKTAVGEVALRAVLNERNSTAFGVNFLTLCNDARVADGLHVAASRLMAEGYGYAGEGDWVTAVMVRGLMAAFARTSFTEIFSVGYADNRLVLRHWGEGNLALAREKPRLAASAFADRSKAEFAVTDFEFAAGEARLVNWNATPTGQGQLVAIRGHVEEERLSKVGGPRAIFRPAVGDVREVLTRYAEAGGSHHLGVAYGVSDQTIQKMGRLAGWQVEVI